MTADLSALLADDAPEYRRQIARGGRAIDGGYPFTPVRDNVLAALLDAAQACLDAEKALADAAVYLAVVRSSRHGTPAGDDCPRCKSDQRELDKLGNALASLRAATRGQA